MLPVSIIAPPSDPPSARTDSAKVITCGRSCACVRGKSLAATCPRLVNSVRASASDAPGARRPMMSIVAPCRGR